VSGAGERVAAPRVTVIIPTYDWSAVLPYSIGSVLRQTFSDFELLVIGDACTDDSAAVVGRYDDSRVHWMNLPTPSGHQSGPNNEGLRRGRGDLVAYLGHDDLWLPHHLAVLVAAVDAGADLACGLTELVSPLRRAREFVPQTAAVTGGWIPPTGLVHRRRLALDVGGWPQPLDVPVDPEVHLVRAMLAAGARATVVRRLTAVKFPATERKAAYRLRRADEQAAWFTRIGSEPDFEQRELATMLLEAERSVRVLLSARLRRRAWAVAGRIARTTLPDTALRWWTRASVNRRRRFRGLAPLP